MVLTPLVSGGFRDMLVRTTTPLSDLSEHISLREMVVPLFRRKTILLAVFVATLAVCAAGAFFMPVHYKATMVIFVDRERLDPIVTAESTSTTPIAPPTITEEEVNSEAQLLTSEDVLANVVRANGLDTRRSSLDFLFPTKSDAERLQRAVKKLASNLTIQNRDKTNLITVTYSSSNPHLSHAVLNSLSSFYIEKHASVHRPHGTYEFFEQEANKYKAALETSEDALKSLGVHHNIADPDDERTDLAEQLATAIGQSQATKQLVGADERRIATDEQQMKVTPKRSRTAETTNPPALLIQQLGTALLAAETKRTQLLAKYDSTYPLVREADQEVEQAKNAIAAAEKGSYLVQSTDRDPAYELLREDLVKTRSDLAAQRAGLALSASGIQQMQAQMVSLTEASLQQADLQREIKANEQNYLLYLSKREQARTSDALDKTRIENVVVAVPPSIPVLPVLSIPLILLIALASATVMSLGSAYLVDYLDPTFHTPSQVVAALDVPLVFTISKQKCIR